MLEVDIPREHELVLSATLGVIFSFGIIYFLHKYPGRPFDYENDRYYDDVSVKKKDDDALQQHDDVQPNGNDDDVDLKTYMQNLDEDEFVRSSTKMRNVFGISEENVRKAVRQTKDDVKNGGSMNDDKFTYSQILDFVVMGGIICVILYFVDIEAHGVHGDISKVLHALFPLEFDTLGVGGGGRRGQ